MSSTTRRFIRGLGALGSVSPSSTVSRISPIPNSPMTATMKSKPFISSVMPNVSRSWPVTMSSPTAARMKPMQDRHERLQRVAAAEPDERRERQELDGEELRRPELERDLRQERREERDQHDREERADERGREGGGQRLAALPCLAIG